MKYILAKTWSCNSFPSRITYDKLLSTFLKIPSGKINLINSCQISYSLSDISQNKSSTVQHILKLTKWQRKYSRGVQRTSWNKDKWLSAQMFCRRYNAFIIQTPFFLKCCTCGALTFLVELSTFWPGVSTKLQHI